MRRDNSHQVVPLLVAGVVALGAIGHAHAGAGEGDREAKEAVLRVAALRAMAGYVQSDAACKPPQDALIAVIAADPKAHRVYDEKIARGAVRAVADAAFQGQMASVARGVDPGNEHKVLEWLRQRMNDKTAGSAGSLRAKFDARIAEDLRSTQSKLVASYREARKSVAAGQVQQAVERLAKNAAGIAPTESEIITACEDGKLRATLVSRTLGKLLGKQLDELLIEAQDELRDKAAGLVADGVSQYHELRQGLDSAPLEAYTPKGIREQLRETAATVQKRKAETRPAHKRVYDFARHFDAWATPIVDRRFEGRIDEVLKAASASMVSASVAKVRDGAAARIGRQLPLHHAKDKSFGIFWGEVKGGLRSRAVSTYRDKARNAHAKHDAAEALADLDEHVGKKLNGPEAACRKSWDALIEATQNALRSVLQKIREERARADAEQYCPDLMNGRWRPDGAELTDYPPDRLDRGALRLLSIWKVAPAVDDGLIEETWELLEAQAKKRLRIGHDALFGQQQIVRKHEGAVAKTIAEDARQGKQPVFEPHYERFRTLVVGDWKKDPLSAEYPQLHVKVQQEMRGIVQKLIDAQYRDMKQLVEKARQRAKATVKRPEDLKDYEDAVSKELGFRVPAVYDKDIAADKKELRAKLAPELQNEVVDRVKPEMARRVRDRIRAGEKPDPNDTRKQFLERIEEQWRKDWPQYAGVLEPGDREILPRVKERITGIVTEMLRLSADLDAKIRQAQSALVRKHEPDVREAMVRDKKQGRPLASRSKAYSSAYEDLVEKSWANDELSREPGYDSLLTGTRNEIRGVVERLVDEIGRTEVAAAPPASTPTPTTREVPGVVIGVANGKTGGDGTGRNGTGGDGAGNGKAATGTGPATGGGVEGQSPGGPASGTGGGMGYPEGPGGNQPGAGGRGAGDSALPPILLILLLLALLIQAVAFLWDRRRERRRWEQSLPILVRGRGRRGPRAVAAAAARQMDLALRCIEVYRPERPVNTLEDLRECGQGLLEQIRSQWDRCRDSAVLPELQVETWQLAIGGVLFAAQMRDGPAPKGS